MGNANFSHSTHQNIRLNYGTLNSLVKTSVVPIGV